MNVLSLCGQEVGLTKNPSVRYTSYQQCYGFITVTHLIACKLFSICVYLFFFCVGDLLQLRGAGPHGAPA